MTLLNSLYTVSKEEKLGGRYAFTLRLHGGCEIYHAHFPGQPVTPGACIIQMAAELAERIAGTALMVTKMTNVKFLSIISPDAVTEIECVIDNIQSDDGGIAFRAVVRSAMGVHAKMNLTCNKITE